MRTAGLAASDAQRVRMLFLAHLEDALYTRLPLRRRHFQLARDWVGRGTVPLAAGEALHLAAAALAERTLATADPALIDAARELGVEVMPVGVPEGEEVLTIHEQSAGAVRVRPGGWWPAEGRASRSTGGPPPAGRRRRPAPPAGRRRAR